MRERRYLQLDVFAEQAGMGNPLGVVLDSEGLDGDAMQALAAWLNLSETVFFLPVDAADADYHVRIFTPGSELPFAGHPSVGAAWAALDCGLLPATRESFVQQCAAGLLPVRAAGEGSDRRIRLRSPRGTRTDAAIGDLPACLQVISRAQSSAELWNNGPDWWLVEAESAAAVRALRPDFSAIAAWTSATAATGVAVFAQEPGASHDVVVRAFCPGDAVNVPEDPVTGSANALVATYLSAQGRWPGRDGHYIASQGRELGRDGRIELSMDSAGEIWIGGGVHAVLRGNVTW